MDKDRITGAAKEAAGNLKQAAGKMLGDAKLFVAGQDEIAQGEVQNALGGVKDELKDSLKK
jgi:uncharacterized protein YjbJ (UPF0337 family)